MAIWAYREKELKRYEWRIPTGTCGARWIDVNEALGDATYKYREVVRRAQGFVPDDAIRVDKDGEDIVIFFEHEIAKPDPFESLKGS